VGSFSRTASRSTPRTFSGELDRERRRQQGRQGRRGRRAPPRS
jgi:hypothetical protein